MYGHRTAPRHREGSLRESHPTTVHKIITDVDHCAACRPVTGTDHRAGYTGTLLQDAILTWAAPTEPSAFGQPISAKVQLLPVGPTWRP